MIAEIIPLARLPKNLSFFDYEVPQNFEGQIKIGQIARIPFRGKKMSGLVVAIKEKSRGRNWCRKTNRKNY